MLGVWPTSSTEKFFFVYANYDLHFRSSVVLTIMKFSDVHSAELNANILGMWMTEIIAAGCEDQKRLRTPALVDHLVRTDDSPLGCVSWPGWITGELGAERASFDKRRREELISSTISLVRMSREQLFPAFTLRMESRSFR